MANPRVVVVTDDDRVRDEATYGFPSEVEVVLCEDATDALPYLDEGPPSLVIVALRTGNSGGFALTRDMSQRNDLKGVPVMILLEREQDEWLARQSGAALFRTKPLNPGELVADALDLMSYPKAS